MPLFTKSQSINDGGHVDHDDGGDDHDDGGHVDHDDGNDDGDNDHDAVPLFNNASSIGDNDSDDYVAPPNARFTRLEKQVGLPRFSQAVLYVATKIPAFIFSFILWQVSSSIVTSDIVINFLAIFLQEWHLCLQI